MMRRVLLWLLPLLLAPALAAGATAADDGRYQTHLYRYKGADGTVAISNRLTTQAIHSGYQVLDTSGRVLKTVAPAPPESRDERRRAAQARQAAAEQARRDKELLELYGRPQDAERARDRQIEALRLKVSYANNAVRRLEEKRDKEVHAAARAERAGRKVPARTREAIARYNRQIREKQANIKQYQSEMEQVRQQFAPMIERLRQLNQPGRARPGAP